MGFGGKTKWGKITEHLLLYYLIKQCSPTLFWACSDISALYNSNRRIKSERIILKYVCPRQCIDDRIEMFCSFGLALYWSTRCKTYLSAKQACRCRPSEFGYCLITDRMRPPPPSETIFAPFFPSRSATWWFREEWHIVRARTEVIQRHFYKNNYVLINSVYHSKSVCRFCL